MYQFKVYDTKGLEFHCSDCYRSEKQARAVFHKRFPDSKQVCAVVIDSRGYKFVAEKPVGVHAFRRCV